MYRFLLIDRNESIGYLVTSTYIDIGGGVIGVGGGEKVVNKKDKVDKKVKW